MTHQSPRTPGPTASERGRRLWNPAKLRNKAGLVGLSSAAILSVYAAGYVHTAANGPGTVQAASVQQVAVVPTATATTALSPTAAPATTRTTGTRPQTTGTAPAATPTTANPGTAASAYKDGTYTGVGTSRHGSIGVSIMVAGGKITSAQITTCQTKYPCSKVAGLPGQVIARQSAMVSYVSGATDSSKAYAGAVAQALAKAAA